MSTAFDCAAYDRRHGGSGKPTKAFGGPVPKPRGADLSRESQGALLLKLTRCRAWHEDYQARLIGLNNAAMKQGIDIAQEHIDALSEIERRWRERMEP